MVGGHPRHTVTDPTGYSLGGHMESQHLPAVTAEPVEKCPGVDVPQADGEVNTPGHEVGRVVPRCRVVGVQQTVDSALVAPE